MREAMKIAPTESSSETVREEVRRRYGATASDKSACADNCCTSTSAIALGYSAEDEAAAPEAANLGLGCGNPLAIASLKQGQVVLDLGSGAGFDCFLAARAVGKSGKVIGVDMTHEMLGNSGFKDIKIAPKDSSRSFIREWLPGKRIEDYLISATIEAVKP